MISATYSKPRKIKYRGGGRDRVNDRDIIPFPKDQ